MRISLWNLCWMINLVSIEDTPNPMYSRFQRNLKKHHKNNIETSRNKCEPPNIFGSLSPGLMYLTNFQHAQVMCTHCICQILQGMYILVQLYIWKKNYQSTKLCLITTLEVACQIWTIWVWAIVLNASFYKVVMVTTPYCTPQRSIFVCLNIKMIETSFKVVYQHTHTYKLGELLIGTIIKLNTVIVIPDCIPLQTQQQCWTLLPIRCLPT